MAKNKKPVKKAKPTFKSVLGSAWAFIKKIFTVKNKKGLKYGAASIVWTALFVAAVVLLNVVAGLLTDRFALRADMTSDSRYSLTEDTKNVLDGISEPINVYVFATEDSYRNMVSSDGRYVFGYELAEMLDRYAAYSHGMITLQYIDPYKNPDWVNKYKGQVTVGLYTIVVEQGDKYVSIPVEDQYYWQNSDAQAAAGIFIERRLTLAIDNMDAGDSPLAVIETGKGEAAISNELLTMLYEKNYTIELIDITYDEIPENAELLVIAMPRYDFTESEIRKLENYLAGYKDMLVLMSSDTPALTNFELYLREWGVEFGNSVICDSKYNIEAIYSAVVTMPTDAAAGLPIMNGLGYSQYVIMPNSRPISLLWRDGTGDDSRTCTALLQTSDAAYAKSRAGGPITSYEKDDGDVSGPFFTGVISTQSGYKDNKEVKSNVVILSSAHVFFDDLVNTGSYGNMQLFVNTIGEFNPTANTITIRGRLFTDPELSVYGNARMVILFFMFAVPTVCLAMAIAIWFRRKNR